MSFEDLLRATIVYSIALFLLLNIFCFLFGMDNGHEICKTKYKSYTLAIVTCTLGERLK